MSLVGQIVVESRRYSGWIDPRYPIGYWFAALSLTGDATGGILTIDLLFQPADPSFLNSQMYSVERFGVTSDLSIDRNMRLTAVNMAGPANLGFSQEYTIRLLLQAGLGSALSPDAMTLVPWFLGAQRIAGISASLSLVSQNIDDSPVKFEAEGYRWSARSVLIDGGPQRPPTGPYRA